MQLAQDVAADRRGTAAAAGDWSQLRVGMVQLQAATNRRHVSPSFAGCWFATVLALCWCVCWCCVQGVVNRDIKLENTLLDSSPRPLVKICDFGYSKVCQQC